MIPRKVLLDYAKERIKNFETEQTSLTLKIIIGGEVVLSTAEREMSNYFFSIFQELKSELMERKKLIENVPDFYSITPKRVNYYYSIRNLKETPIAILDLKSAYITIAHSIGFISDDLYEKINGLTKHERLIILGMIASYPYKCVYRSGELFSIKRVKKDPFLYQVFVYIQYRLGLVMEDIKQEYPRDIIYYWVDEIGFFPDVLFTITDYVERKFQFKIQSKMCEIETDGILTYIFIDGENKLIIPGEFSLSKNTETLVKKYLSQL